jgi:hypothetical protein
MALRQRSRAAAWAAAFFVALGAVASDKVPVQRPADGGEIGAAAQQLKELKADAAARDASPRSAGPSLSVPALNVSPANPAPTPSPLPSEAVTKRSENWLVDGVMKPKPSRIGDPATTEKPAARRNRSESVSDRGELEDETAQADGSKSSEARERQSEEEERRERSRTTFDPMARFMADWLTPGDYALLRPAVSGNASTSALPGEPAPVASDLSAALESWSTGGAGGIGDPKVPLPGAKPADNPFLQFLTPPETPAAPLSPPVTFAPPPPAPLATPAAPVEERRPTSNLPDFVRPTSDDKYFKPLKKF